MSLRFAARQLRATERSYSSFGESAEMRLTRLAAVGLDAQHFRRSSAEDAAAKADRQGRSGADVWKVG